MGVFFLVKPPLVVINSMRGMLEHCLAGSGREELPTQLEHLIDHKRSKRY